MHTNDQTANAVRNSDGVDAQTTTNGPGGLGGSSAPTAALSGVASSHPKPNGLVLEALTERAMVRIEVDGEIVPEGVLGASDAINDDVVICQIDGAGEREAFRFSGTMADLEVVEGDVEVALDLHRDVPSDGGSPTRLSVHAQGAEVDYEFAVSGGVEYEPGDAPRDWERADEAVTGAVSGSGVDEYLFTGEITEFEASTDDVLVMIGDRVVDPGALD